MPTSTPWGTAQTSEKACRGINFYSTASHGGYKVSDKLNLEIPEVFRRADGWYEEDCDWSIVWVFLSAHFDKEYFKPETFLQADKTLKQWFPHEWQEYNDQPISRIDTCWDCNKNTCRATVNDYPKEIGNTGYGNYRVITKEVGPGRYAVETYCRDQLIISEYKTSDIIEWARSYHGQVVDKIMSGVYFEPMGYPKAFPILREG